MSRQKAYPTKRVVGKPLRYCTSSDDCPKQKMKKTATSGMMDKHINDMERMLEDENFTDNNIETHTHTTHTNPQHTQPNADRPIQPSINKQPQYTNKPYTDKQYSHSYIDTQHIQPNTDKPIQPSRDKQPQRYTDKQLHTDKQYLQLHATEEPQSYTDQQYPRSYTDKQHFQPHTDRTQHSDMQSYTDTQDTQLYTDDTRLNTNMQTHTNMFYTGYIPRTQAKAHTHTSPIVAQEQYTQNERSFTAHTESEKLYYTNDTLSQMQGARRTSTVRKVQCYYQQDTDPGHAALDHLRESPSQRPNHDIEERLDKLEAHLKKMDGVLQKILKCVQERHTTPKKPDGLPITSLQEMEAFENFDDEGYSDIVNYLHYIGGFNLKEAAYLCLKECVCDILTLSFTWFGREEDKKPLYNIRLAQAIYDAICRNRHFAKPLRSDFQKHMQEALRIAKERHRSRTRVRRQRNIAAIDRDIWNDEEEHKSADEESNI